VAITGYNADQYNTTQS